MRIFMEEDLEHRNNNLERIKEVRKLITAGYSNAQIIGLKPLIMQGLTAEELIKMFGTNTKISEIEEVAKMV